MTTSMTPSSERGGLDPGSLPSKTPRTDRGRKTLRKLLDAAALEFGDKGFHEASITGITARAGTALGTFYTYFHSKDEIFRALVRDMSDKVRGSAQEAMSCAGTALEIERAALVGFLEFAREHQEVYRIIDEAEFVDPESYRKHYTTTAQRIHGRLQQGMASGELRGDLTEAHAWAIMGMNVFLGMRYSIWSEAEAISDIADAAGSLLASGIRAPGGVGGAG